MSAPKTLFCTICFLAGVFALSGAAPVPPPNILLIVGDDMGCADVGFHGCRDLPTPHFDTLAAAGVRFTDAYVSSPYCSPTRAALITGRYQQRFGHEFQPRREQGMSVQETTTGGAQEQQTMIHLTP
jgi:arylsulfatase A-like enzyme